MGTSGEQNLGISECNTGYTSLCSLALSAQTISALCTAWASIESAKLGFKIKEAGTHLLWSGAAMEMYLAGVPIYTIMLIGRWPSNAFLRYIWKHVEQFLKHLLKQMIQFP